MATLVNRYVIRHLTGAKANQVEEFDYKKYNELTFGRAATNLVRFDPERDSAVSREHGKIVREPGKSFLFTVVDNNSRNGIFVNKNRIAGAAPVQPGDEIQLGQGGPVFQFDLNPRPAELMMNTRVVDIPVSIKPTTELSLTEAVGDSNDSDVLVPQKVGLGKQTVERMMLSERKKTNKSVLLSVAGVLVVLSGLAYAFRDELNPKPQTITVHHHDSTKVIEPVKDGLTPEQIATENTGKVVFIEFGYKLIHTESGDDVYHEYMPIKLPDGRIVNKALYIETSPGKIEPLLGLKQTVKNGKPIAMAGASGSGFVVTPQGHIMTNRHVAAAWNSYYSFPPDAFPGVLLVQGEKGWEISQQPVQEFRWVPSETQFFGKKPMSGKIITGVNTYMDVTFNKNEQRFPAQEKPVISAKHDVAILKIDLGESLPAVKLLDADKTVAPGQSITVMGYPGISPDVYVGEYSSDFSNRNPQIVKVPDATITPGFIGKILRGQAAGKAAAYYSEFGDYYQLTANATGAGNSGGPVFDKDGNAIGIFSASTSREDATRITFAIPIKYGLELLGRRQVVD
jgi:S1-C subfamily serine protease/pSer/pThr/pTyr-binding forkhead associated (FHA) protein